MTLSNLTSANLSGLIKQFSAGRFESTINNASPLLKSKALQKDDCEGEEWIKEVYVGGHSPTMFAADFGTRPRGTALVPLKAKQLPTIVTSTLTMGKLATLSKLDDDRLASLFDSNLQAVAEDAARHLNRGIYGGSIAPQAGATWTGTAANSTVTVPFLDISMFRPGMAVDFRDVSSGLDYVVRVTGVAPAALGANSDAVAGNVSFINDVPGQVSGLVNVLTDTTVATGDSFLLRGTTAAGSAATAVGVTAATGAPMVSIDDIAGSGAASVTVHGIAPGTTPSWSGQTKALSAAYSQEAALSFMMRIHAQAGEMPTHVIMSPQVAAAHAASAGFQGAVFGVGSLSISAATPRNIDRSMDKFGGMSDGYEDSGLRLGGKPIVIDPNCPATTIVFHNTEKLKLMEWQKMEPEEEDGNSVFLNRTTLSNDAYITGALNLAVQKRSAIGTITGITGL